MNLERKSVIRDATGMWPAIFSALDIDVGEGKEMPCPSCGGTDRFVFDDKNGRGDYFCRQCGAGDGIQLIQKCKGVDFPMALKMVAGFTGTQPERGIVGNSNTAELPKIKGALNKLWADSDPLKGSDPVSQYLRSRGIMLTPENVRYCPECYESETKKKYPAMVARLQDADGQPVSIHRTYLADLPVRKKLMPGVKKLNGAAIRLMPPGETLGIAEGIETALSAAQLYSIPVWASIGTALLESWLPPEGIRKIIVYSDNDGNFAGQAAAYKLAHRLYLADCIVSVEIPDITGDWNDVLKGL